MTIAQAFNDIAVAHGGTASNSGTIAGAIDALNDALAGSDQQAATTIEGAVRLLGEHIGTGGSSVQSYTITKKPTENGSFVCKVYDWDTKEATGGEISSAYPGDTVAVVCTAAEDYYTDDVSVQIGEFDYIPYNLSLDTAIFVMPEHDVDVYVEFYASDDDPDGPIS